MPIMKSSKVLVFDLINAANPQLPYPLTPDNCRIDKVYPVYPDATSGGRNTMARLRGAQGEGYTDQFTLYYDRLQLGKVIRMVDPKSPKGPHFVSFTAKSIHKALPVISATYGVELGPWDVNDTTLANPSVPNAVVNVTMTSHANSPAYVGPVTLRLLRGKALLEEAIKQPVIAPCQHPIPVTAQTQCVDMLTFGVDFTAYRSALTVTAGGMPNWAELRAVLDTLGIPAYPAPANNTVVDQPTSAVATANKDYDRVVVHSGVNAAGIKGTAYYHYNT